MVVLVSPTTPGAGGTLNVHGMAGPVITPLLCCRADMVAMSGATDAGGCVVNSSVSMHTASPTNAVRNKTAPALLGAMGLAMGGTPID